MTPRKHTWGPGYYGGPGAYWTEERIIQKIQEWTATHGTPPLYEDWHPADARRRGRPGKAERFEAGDWPSSATVVKQFGSFRVALAKAGYPRLRRQGPPVSLAKVRRSRSGRIAVGQNALATQIRAVAAARVSGDVRQLADALDALAITAATYAEQVRRPLEEVGRAVG